MQFITTDQRIAVENFEIGLIYTITFTNGRYFSGSCTGIGADFVMFQRTLPELAYCLNMAGAADIESIEQTGGGGGTLNYNDLYNKPQINGVELVGNKSSSELGLLDPADLTPLQAALVELIDSGAKNKLSIGTPTTVPAGLSITRNNDGSYIVSGSLAAANSIIFNIDALSGDLILSGCPAGGGNNSYLLRLTKSGSQVSGSVDTGNGSDIFTMDGSGYALNMRFAAGSYTDLIFKPMICSAAAWAISQAYVPYTPTLYELYQMIQG